MAAVATMNGFMGESHISALTLTLFEVEFHLGSKYLCVWIINHTHPALNINTKRVFPQYLFHQRLIAVKMYTQCQYHVETFVADGESLRNRKHQNHLFLQVWCLKILNSFLILWLNHLTWMYKLQYVVSKFIFENSKNSQALQIF